MSQLFVGIFPKMSTSVWYSIFQNVEQATVKTKKGGNLDIILDKYLNFRFTNIVFASILEVY